MNGRIRIGGVRVGRVDVGIQAALGAIGILVGWVGMGEDICSR